MATVVCLVSALPGTLRENPMASRGFRRVLQHPTMMRERRLYAAGVPNSREEQGGDPA